MDATSAPDTPRATYRLQFSADFTFRDAARIVPYLAALGISHVYASPYLAARQGSTHGYDVVDHNALNPEIGSEKDFAAFVAALGKHGMGHILDFVPNHMGIAQSDNVWWLDVLEWGDASPYAAYFDIDWEAEKAALRGKVLLPFLGDHYGRVLSSGDLTLNFEVETGSLSAWYYEHRFPLSLHTYPRVLLAGLPGQPEADAPPWPQLTELLREFRNVRTRGRSKRQQAERRRRGLELKERLGALYAREPAIREAVDRAVATFNRPEGVNADYRALDRLLNRQHYRLAFWRVAGQEINYRRFFDINDLAGLNTEKLEVFDALHTFVFSLIGEETLQGLRIDHIDGLYDPAQYCRRVRERAPKGDIYLTVEKILAIEEKLPAWPIDGTTGYETMAYITGLFVDPAAERAFNRVYRRFGGSLDYRRIVYEAKHLIMETVLASEIQVLAARLDRISESHPDTRDFTFNDLHRALKEIIAQFPVYRTYISRRQVSEMDRRFIERAVTAAMRISNLPDKAIFPFIQRVLTTDVVRSPGSGINRRRVIDFAMKFQQYTGPVMAKSVEDTAFYRYGRLIALNEVGSEPDHFGMPVETFHTKMAERAKRWPHAMTAVATHDAKRGDDARARIAALSLIPDEWSAALVRWRRMNRTRKALVGNSIAPSGPEEYFLYQSLVGAWPEAESSSGSELGDLQSRMGEFAVKALREAKANSSWVSADEPYEEAVVRFLTNLLDRGRSARFLADFAAFQERLAPLARTISLAQTVLHMTVPGVPDIYQGGELWNHALVDPDNRRPVDYDKRMTVLRILSEPQGGDAALVRDLLKRPADGRLKLYLTYRLLQHRQAQPAIYLDGDYRPMTATGPRSANICAFARRRGRERIVVATLRQSHDLLAEDWTKSRDALADSVIPVPGRAAAVTDILTGRRLSTQRSGRNTQISASECFALLPAAVLVPAEHG